MFPKIYRVARKDQLYTVSFRVRQVEGGGPLDLGFAARTRGGWQSLGLLARIAPARDGQPSATRSSRQRPRSAKSSSRASRPARTRSTTFLQTRARRPLNDPASLNSARCRVRKNREFAPPQTRDFYQFLIDTERNYWTGIAGYLRTS